ncbi:MAG: hypothetical protein OXF79_03145 [Chloroflexi bacterium]|nr:hypothetical protein [Chloroflexota bacterium]
MLPSRPWARRVQAEVLRGYPLEAVAQALGYRSDPDHDARWRRSGSVLSINRFMFYDHLRAQGGAGAIELAVHALGCPPQDAIDFLAKPGRHSRLPGGRRQAPAPHRDLRWNVLRQYLVERRGLGDALVDLGRELGLIHADRRGNPVFVRRNAAGNPVGIETLTAAQKPDARGGFWMSWEPDWPASVILAGNALDALSILSLHLVPAMRHGCAVVSTGTVTARTPKWIEDWNPSRIFCAWDATPNGDHHAQRLQDKDTRVVRLRPALDGQDWNDMLIRDRAGEPLQTDDRPIG